MKKKMLIGVISLVAVTIISAILVIAFGTVVWTTPFVLCSDTDGGDYPFTPGVATIDLFNGTNQTYPDFCNGQYELHEYVCNFTSMRLEEHAGNCTFNNTNRCTGLPAECV